MKKRITIIAIICTLLLGTACVFLVLYHSVTPVNKAVHFNMSRFAFGLFQGEPDEEYSLVNGDTVKKYHESFYEIPLTATYHFNKNNRLSFIQYELEGNFNKGDLFEQFYLYYEKEFKNVSVHKGNESAGISVKNCLVVRFQFNENEQQDASIISIREYEG